MGTARILFLLLLALAAGPAAAAIQGYSTASMCGEAGNWLDVSFTSDEGVRLVDVHWDFSETSIWLDASEIGQCGTANEGFVDFDFYFDDPVGTDTQGFGMTCSWFDSGDYVKITMDLDVNGGGSPFTSHYEGAVVTVEFSDGTILTAPFDEPYDAPNGARATFVKLDPALPNYTIIGRIGWASPLVPRPADDASSYDVPAPATLTGDGDTWLNGVVYNNTAVAVGAMQLAFHLDAQPLHQINYFFGVAPLTYLTALNQGPFTIPGGRHTLRMTADALNVVNESDETDNVYAVQYGWAGAALDPLDVMTRAAPPQAWADTDLLMSYGYNCDGVRVTPSPAYHWAAVWCEPVDPAITANYLLRNFETTDDPTEAFLHPLNASRGGGDLQCLIFNTSTYGGGPWDIAIHNGTVATYDYRIGHIHESPYGLYFDVELGLPVTVQRVMPLEFTAGAGDLGPATIVVRTDPDDGPLHVGWLAPDFARGNLDDLQDATVTDELGYAKINFEVTATGRHAAMVYGNQDERPGNVSASVALFHARPDLEPATMAGWHAPIVPRASDDATLFACPEPDTLLGDQEATWMNLAFMNSGNAAADTLRRAIYIDGNFDLYRYGTAVPLAAGEYHSDRNLVKIDDPWRIPGGRHTLGLALDHLDDETESIEDNNVAGRQYCWAPAVLPATRQLIRSSVPDRDDGRDMCGPGVTTWPNCDGLRLPSLMDGTYARWRAVAVLADHSAMDLDMDLHEPLVGTADGFGPHKVAESAWELGHLELIVLNDLLAGTGPYDVGVHGGPSHSLGGYTAHAAYSTYLGKYLDGQAGPFALEPAELLHLWEVTLEAGPQFVSLTNLEGNVDWGLSIYEAGAFRSKGDTPDGGMAWQAGDGRGESILIDVPARANYAIAVWKMYTDDLMREGSYTLTFQPGVSAAPDERQDLPAVSRLTGAAPNPFNPRTVIAFEIAQRGPCRVTLHDLQGRVVRTLVTGDLEPGRHEAVWDGLDEGGRRVASGVYMARLQAPGTADLLKVTLLK